MNAASSLFLIRVTNEPDQLIYSSRETAEQIKRGRCDVSRGVYTQTGLAYESPQGEVVELFETRLALELGILGERDCLVRYTKTANALDMTMVTLYSVSTDALPFDLLKLIDSDEATCIAVAIEVCLDGERECAA